MISEHELLEEFTDLAAEAGITESCAVEFPDYMSERHQEDPRSYAEVDPKMLHFYFAREILDLPRSHRQGIMMHEIGHVLCRKLPSGGSEKDADEAAYQVFGQRIHYDCRWPGKGLQRTNPPYQGWRKGWWQRKLPKDEYKRCYRTKRDALNVFMEHNRNLIEDYGGESMKHSPESFEAINHLYDIKGKRRVDTIARAVWWALPGPAPYCLEDIDIDILNRTAPVIYNQQELAFAMPDHVEEARLAELEEEYYAERYGSVEYPEEAEELLEDEIPF